MSDSETTIERHAPASEFQISSNGAASHEIVESRRGQEETLHPVSVGAQSIDAYSPIIGEDRMEELRRLAEPLKGARVLQINATPYGGGVAELLRSQTPLMRSLGIQTDWKVIHGEAPFYQVTKSFHNALQGADYDLTESVKDTYLSTNARNADLIDGDYDYIIVHDPQPAAVRAIHGGNGSKWVWRCHIDTSDPHAGVWNFLQPYVEQYDAMVFTMDQYVSPGLDRSKVSLMPPAIDPLSPKNISLTTDFCKRIVSWVGVDTTRPLITQVSRFDPWKDPLGVVEVYRSLRPRVPGLQLAMLGHLAMDDPQGWEIFGQVQAEVEGDPDVHLFTNYTAASSIEVNAFQSFSDVIIQKSLREGFGLVVSEAMWKGSPVVAGRAGGIPLQMEDGESGYLVDSTEECTEKVLFLLENPQEARRIGANGHKFVRDNNLMPRLIAQELELLNSL